MFALLAVIGIVYGAMVALVQKDFKFVIGYSSVSHMGFVLLGLMTLNTVGLSGAVLQMFSHGIVAGLLFAVVGRMVYDRTHTRELAALQGMKLGRAIPFAAVTFVMAGRRFDGPAGLQRIRRGIAGARSGRGRRSRRWRCWPGAGIVIGVAYTWRAMQQAFFGEVAAPEGSPPRSWRIRGRTRRRWSRISIPERLGAALLIGISLAIGLYPISC